MFIKDAEPKAKRPSKHAQNYAAAIEAVLGGNLRTGDVELPDDVKVLECTNCSATRVVPFGMWKIYTVKTDKKFTCDLAGGSCDGNLKRRRH